MFKIDKNAMVEEQYFKENFPNHKLFFLKVKVILH